ncbi:type II toxin-antitoxin system prevent-host-death family antitoxin [Fontimonas sp. SYSU GA230001]|uniref:type II toxin-antitoxin system prevent-host-death family antitoxin n=1 Tax=Fontimonas sp. SYSU GA230001 TaxID=3142450 RepID=UPI0032B3A3DB
MDAKQVPIHELKARLSHYLAEARRGRPVEITSHRRVVARLVGVPEATGTGSLDEAVARLIAEGKATWSGGKPKGAALRLSPGGPSLSDIVIEDRGPQ